MERMPCCDARLYVSVEDSRRNLGTLFANRFEDTTEGKVIKFKGRYTDVRATLLVHGGLKFCPACGKPLTP